jgi:aryl carrier-like protein
MADMECHAKALQIQSGSRVLQFASYGFGVSVIEIFCTLSMGGTVCIPSDYDRLNELVEIINTMDISWVLLTPAVINYLKSGSVPRLKTLVLAGEPPSTNHISTWASSVQLVIAYGFTEWSGICCVQPSVNIGSNPQNIGFSTTSRLWLCEPGNYNKLAPIGAVAELLVEGPSLARGYLGDQERNAKSFINSPSWSKDFVSQSGSKFYGTGDLVRYCSDGSLVYLGRKDLQKKIRGQRVEMGEVEYHVREAFSNASKVVVEVIVPAKTKVPVLAAFVWYVKKNAVEITGVIDETGSEEFRSGVALADQKIRSLLPKYMVPDFYIPLAKVPLTVSGKVDRRQLRDWASKQARSALESYGSTQSPKRYPETEMEKNIHRLFVHLLSLSPESIGIDDSFLRLGGHSISAMALATECRRQGIALTFQDIFQEKTIAKLATIASRSKPGIVELESEGQESLLLNGQEVSLNTTPTPRDQNLETFLTFKLRAIGISYHTDVEDIYQCSPIQQGMLVSQARKAEHYQMRFWWKIVAGPSGPVDIDRLKEAWWLVVKNHSILRTIFVEGMAQDSAFLQIVLRSEVSRASPITIVEETVLSYADNSTKTFRDSLPRLELCVSQNGEVTCTLFISHSLIDATSMNILRRDIALAYDGHDFPVRGLPYRDYISYLQNLPGESDLAYWKEYLAGFSPCLFPLVNIETHRNGKSKQFQTVVLELPNSSDFYKFSEETGVTIATVFHLAWGLTLKSYTGMDSVGFGYPTAGRNLPLQGLDDAVGPFINMLICRVEISKGLSLLQVLDRIQADCIAGITHQHVSLTELFHDMKLSGGSLFNTTMTFSPEMSPTLLNRLSIRLQDIAKYDPTEVSSERLFPIAC